MNYFTENLGVCFQKDRGELGERKMNAFLVTGMIGKQAKCIYIFILGNALIKDELSHDKYDCIREREDGEKLYSGE